VTCVQNTRAQVQAVVVGAGPAAAMGAAYSEAALGPGNAKPLVLLEVKIRAGQRKDRFVEKMTPIPLAMHR